MTLRDALDDYKRATDEETVFPGERRSTSGLFAGRDGRLVHVGRDGVLRDYGYPLTGLNGVERSRFGVRRDDAIAWLDDCPTQYQRYHGDTALVVTEHATDAGTVTQYDLTLGDAHVTHFEVGSDAELVAVVGFAPDGRDAPVGQLRHDGAVEVFHADEHDFLGSATGFAEYRGEVPATFEELLADDPVDLPRGETEGRYEESRLSGVFVCELPTEGGTATLATLLTDRTETSRDDALARVGGLTETHADAATLERAARVRSPNAVDSSVPHADAAAADLRVLDLLSAPTGLHIAGPDFDPFCAYSGGYGYTWFRDDAEIARFLLDSDRRFGFDLDDAHARVAEIYCEAQCDDGTWPHRVWPRDASLAPGWANGRLEAGDDVDYQADQTGSVVAFLGAYLDATDSDAALESRITETLERALDGLDDTLAADGRPVACQNAWEDATGRFAHTTATFLDAYATLAVTGPTVDVTERAATQAERVYDAVDDLWVPDRGVYALRERDGELDARCDSAAFALASAHHTYAEVNDLDDERVERLASHVRTLADELWRDTEAARGLIRYEGDDWRAKGQDREKIWTVSTAWGAHAAANVAAMLADRGEDPTEFEALARNLLSLVLPDGPLCMESGYLPEQVFDDGTPDSATPLGWPHALRLATVALMDEYEMLRPVSASD